MNREITPIVKSNNTEFNNSLYIKRDDLYPYVFGGNKARIVEKLVEDAIAKECNYIIGYGSTSSNMNRALANYCKIKDIPCTIICCRNNDEKLTNNSKIIEVCKANIEYCYKENVAETVEKVIVDAESKGFKPYYIYGNKYGEGNEKISALAYIDVYDEILEQENQLGIKFDYIFCGTGTGMTQSGLIVGKLLSKNKHKIIGISIARKSEIELPILEKRVKSCLADNVELGSEIQLYDKAIGEGYGAITDRLKETIIEEIEIDGISLDKTYTGKAFMGMKDYLKENNINNKNILFIHTGGNPLFWDELKHIYYENYK